MMDRVSENTGHSKSKFTNIGFIQFEIISGMPESNLATVRSRLKELHPPEGSLIVLPELWASGFCYDDMQQELLRICGRLDEIKREIQKLAGEYGIYLAGTLPEDTREDAGKFYNTLSIYDGNGLCGTTQKSHLFVGEEQAFVAGKGRQITTHSGIVAAGICFDLRFPEVVRRQAADADLLIYSAQWPKSRIYHWVSLLIARAIENQIFVIGCNASGANEGPELGGSSMIIAPDGRILEQAGGEDAALMAAVQWQEMAEVRGRFRSCPAELL